MRALVALLGTGLAIGTVVLAAHGGGSHAGRVLGLGILLGVALIAVAWRGAL